MNDLNKNYLPLLIFIGLFDVTTQFGCDNQVLFKVFIRTPNDEQFVKQVYAQSSIYNITIDRAIRRSNQVALFRTSVCIQPSIENLLKLYRVESYETEIYPESSKRFLAEATEKKLTESDFNTASDFDIAAKRYLTSDEINTYTIKFVEFLNKNFPSVDTRLHLEGYSYEKRPIYTVFIGYKDKRNPVVFIDAGIHAREWHSRSLALFIMRELINEAELYEKGLLFTTSFVILPNVNPDGYEYSRTREKMWRKTRRPLDKNCIGVDGNRNFDEHWWMGDYENKPCAEVYKGEKPFSESETQIVKDVLLRIKDHCILYITIHTYGNTIIYPYGYTKKAHPKKNLFHQIGMAGVKAALAKTGTKFVTDQSGNQLYIAAGGSDDWAVDKAGIPFSFTLELGAEHLGFFVPVSEIESTVLDGWIVTRAMIDEVEKIMKLN